MSKKEHYHHSNLKEELINLAVKEAEQCGIESFSMRSLSKKLNVSHMAPYRHFASKEALVVQLVILGFEKLTELLESKIEDSFTIIKKLKCIGLSFKEFALNEPGYYNLMVSYDWNIDEIELELHEVKIRLIKYIADIIKEGQDINIIKEGNSILLALTFAISIHGTIENLLKRKINWKLLKNDFQDFNTEFKDVDERDADDILLNSIIDSLIQGLMLK